MSEKKSDNKGGKTETPLVADMLASGGKKTSSAELMVEPEVPASEADSFAKELERTLQETERAVLDLEGRKPESGQGVSWQKARSVVEGFRPVPPFIWRLSNYVLGNPDTINSASEGLVFGLRRLLFAAASDEVLGTGSKVNSVHVALDVLPSDVVAAVSVIHAISRRLASRQFERIWRPILDDAILRAQIGYYVGEHSPKFGRGRGMLAGFAGRCGLAILISSGDLDQARKALEMLATGAEIKDVGLALYGCDPLQISAMTLSAAGCGRDAAFGTVSYAGVAPATAAGLPSAAQRSWYAAFYLCEYIRTGRSDKIPASIWNELGFTGSELKKEVEDRSRNALRRGHGWNWLGPQD